MSAEAYKYSEMADLPEDLFEKIWEVTVEDWLHRKRPRDLSQPEEHEDIVLTLAEHTTHDVLEIESFWPQVCAEITIARATFGQRPNLAPPIIGIPPEGIE
jgi:hypothetical protein